MNDENTETVEVEETDEAELHSELPAVVGYEAFVGVDPEYRNENRQASMTQGELDTLHNAGLKTDAERHRENQANVVAAWNDANVVEDADAPVEDDGTDVGGLSVEKPAEKDDDSTIESPLL